MLVDVEGEVVDSIPEGLAGPLFLSVLREQSRTSLLAAPTLIYLDTTLAPD
jgi:hypothetical protein